jgi:hypothetical protein
LRSVGHTFILDPDTQPNKRLHLTAARPAQCRDWRWPGGPPQVSRMTLGCSG